MAIFIYLNLSKNLSVNIFLDWMIIILNMCILFTKKGKYAILCLKRPLLIMRVNLEVLLFILLYLTIMSSPPAFVSIPHTIVFTLAFPLIVIIFMRI